MKSQTRLFYSKRRKDYPTAVVFVDVIFHLTSREKNTNRMLKKIGIGALRVFFFSNQKTLL